MRNTTGFDEENIKYLKKKLGRREVQIFLWVSKRGALSEKEMKTYERVKRCLTAMQEFGENRWWLSDDKRLIAYYQFHTDVFLVPFETFRDAVVFLLGRPVFSYEIWCDWEERKKRLRRLLTEFHIPKKNGKKLLPSLWRS